MGYCYSNLLKDCNKLINTYSFADMFSIGESVMEKKIFCIKIGTGEKKLFINGSHHGLEYLTSSFIMKFLHRLCNAYYNRENMLSYDICELLENVSLYAVPMVNPDGVDIAVNGIDITNPYHQKLISKVGIHSFNKVWQANVNGVDINHNYDANWKPVIEHPSPSKYAGPYSESEPETKAIVDFVRSENFDMLIAFHSQGGEIYYDFDGSLSENSLEIATHMANAAGYTVAIPTGSASFGGCKDWFIKEFGKAGFTVEIGHGRNPLPDEMLDKIYENNAKIVLCAMKDIIEVKG